MPTIGGIVAFDDIVSDDRAITTTPPLTGGGDLTADRVLGITVGPGGVADNNDPRLNDARAWTLFAGTPTTAGQVPAYDPGTGKFVPAEQTGGGGGSVDAEQVRDIVADLLQPGTNISISVNDPGDTILISASGGEGGTTSDATTTSKGIIQLAGDLAGTAAAPTVPGAQKTAQKSTAATPVPNGYIGADAAGITPAALLPAASTTASGIVRLAGDLGGTASAPTIVRRGPLGGHVSLTYAATITIDASTGNDFYVTATGNLTLAAPTGAVDGQVCLVEVYATGTTRTVSFGTGVTFVSGIGTGLTIAVGKSGFIAMRYSMRNTSSPHWIVHALAVEA